MYRGQAKKNESSIKKRVKSFAYQNTNLITWKFENIFLQKLILFISFDSQFIPSIHVNKTAIHLWTFFSGLLV